MHIGHLPKIMLHPHMDVLTIDVDTDHVDLRANFKRLRGDLGLNFHILDRDHAHELARVLQEASEALGRHYAPTSEYE